MVDFLYTDEYSVSDRLNYLKTGGASIRYAEEVVAHAEVYVVSIIYGIPELEACASRYIQIALADDQELKEFPQLIETLYGGAQKLDPGLKHALLEYAAKHMEALLSAERFRSIFQSSPNFVADAMSRALKMAKENQKENKSQAMGLQESYEQMYEEDSDEEDSDSDDWDSDDWDSDDSDEDDSDEDDSDEDDSDEDEDMDDEDDHFYFGG
ncbi:uncharacterized protein LTHEOB_8502 [Lasiodiplodia theobromae]|uniref:uncharacterized protein n=1 Tax=Lasiodiplodia theobromae TaxID=45133 RepID=UPI0015C324C5|nr:uncharacterized protein LTHEOB_8502 [Lasiodiplodia theobromae]KAF4541507.1 hypothetical protein LTHEOB_8502 [Lasiodiplodia theobromae]